jgi:hypothetical protein
MPEPHGGIDSDQGISLLIVALLGVTLVGVTHGAGGCEDFGNGGAASGKRYAGEKGVESQTRVEGGWWARARNLGGGLLS